LLKQFEPEIERIILVPSTGGRFEVEVNGNTIYSKLTSGRHAKAGEVVNLVRENFKDF
jgi:selenoprotein W-related protein